MVHSTRHRSFLSPSTPNTHHRHISTSLHESPTDVERFQALMRDLQIEGVPLLECDADQVNNYLAALWTTLSEMSESDDGQRALLVLEKIPLGALSAFTEDFIILKQQSRLIEHLPELSRISVSILGKDAGPALLLETADRTDEEKAERAARVNAALGKTDEAKCTAALRQFVDRMVIGEQACPYTQTVDLAATGLEARGVTPGPVAYRFSPTTDCCGALASFWTSVCELSSFAESDLSTTVLSLPGIASGVDEKSHTRFATVMELVSRNLCLYRGDDVFGLVHFHPAYDRDAIVPVDKPAYGHLPPRSWLKPMMRHMNTNTEEERNAMTDHDLAMSDYQRKSPHTAINILRASQLNAASGGKSIVDLQLDDGSVEKASGLTTYCRNAIRLAGVGQANLEASLQQEIQMSSA